MLETASRRLSLSFRVSLRPVALPSRTVTLWRFPSLRRVTTQRTQAGVPLPTHPAGGLLTSLASSSPPSLPTLFQVGTPMGFTPSERFPSDGAVSVSRYLCLHAVPHNAHLRRFRRCAAAPRLYSPPKSVTYHTALTPVAAAALLGFSPSRAFSPGNQAPCGATLMSFKFWRPKPTSPWTSGRYQRPG